MEIGSVTKKEMVSSVVIFWYVRERGSFTLLPEVQGTLPLLVY